MSRKKVNMEMKWWNTSFHSIIAFKWGQWKSDQRRIVLWIVEMILAVGIGASIAVYLDPEWNVVPFPWNIGAFLILLGMAIWVHGRTKPYRIARKVDKIKN